MTEILPDIPDWAILAIGYLGGYVGLGIMAFIYWIFGYD